MVIGANDYLTDSLTALDANSTAATSIGFSVDQLRAYAEQYEPVRIYMEEVARLYPEFEHQFSWAMLRRVPAIAAICESGTADIAGAINSLMVKGAPASGLGPIAQFVPPNWYSNQVGDGFLDRLDARLRNTLTVESYTVPPSHYVFGLYYPVAMDARSYNDGQLTDGDGDNLPGDWDVWYGYHAHHDEGYAYTTHYGADLRNDSRIAVNSGGLATPVAQFGAPVFSIASVVVVFSGYSGPQHEYAVVVQHVASQAITLADGRVIEPGQVFYSRYLHLNNNLVVNAGDLVTGGQELGQINPGQNSHLHIDVSTIAEFGQGRQNWPGPELMDYYDHHGMMTDPIQMLNLNGASPPPYYYDGQRAVSYPNTVAADAIKAQEINIMSDHKATSEYQNISYGEDQAQQANSGTENGGYRILARVIDLDPSTPGIETGRTQWGYQSLPVEIVIMSPQGDEVAAFQAWHSGKRHSDYMPGLFNDLTGDGDDVNVSFALDYRNNSDTPQMTTNGMNGFHYPSYDGLMQGYFIPTITPDSSDLLPEYANALNLWGASGDELTNPDAKQIGLHPGAVRGTSGCIEMNASNELSPTASPELFEAYVQGYAGITGMSLDDSRAAIMQRAAEVAAQGSGRFFSQAHMFDMMFNAILATGDRPQSLDFVIPDYPLNHENDAFDWSYVLQEEGISSNTNLVPDNTPVLQRSGGEEQGYNL